MTPNNVLPFPAAKSAKTKPTFAPKRFDPIHAAIKLHALAVEGSALAMELIEIETGDPSVLAFGEYAGNRMAELQGYAFEQVVLRAPITHTGALELLRYAMTLENGDYLRSVVRTILKSPPQTR